MTQSVNSLKLLGIAIEKQKYKMGYNWILMMIIIIIGVLQSQASFLFNLSYHR